MSMCDRPHAGFARRATLVARKGGRWYRDTEGTPSGAAPTSPPEGVFRHTRRLELDEQSGRTAGRLGCTGPATAYAIGGTAAMAPRYSNFHFATPPEGSPAVAHAMKAPAPPLPQGGGVLSKAAGV